MAGLISLSHIKDDANDGREPWERADSAFASAPTKTRRIPWEGGKITSNKDEALVKFLKRKLERGEELSETQRQALVVAAKGTKLEAQSEAAVLKAADEATVPIDLPSKAEMQKKKNKIPQQQQQQQRRGKGGGGGGRGKPNGASKPNGNKRPLKQNTVRKLSKQPTNKKLHAAKGDKGLSTRIDAGLSSGR